MSDEVKMYRAQEMYRTLCAALDNRGWNYNKKEENLQVYFGVNGDDIPMQVTLFVEPGKELLSLLSPLPFQMSEDKRVEGAIAACVASFGMADGSFDYDITEGGITFRLVASYRDSVLGEGAVQYMLSCACAMIDEYNDRFLALEKGMISIEKFIEMSK